MTELLRTPLHELHVSRGAKMVPFAGYDMPVQYPLGVLKEHEHTRTKAGLFDVSHMGQVRIDGAPFDVVAHALEAIIPVDIGALGVNRQRYGFFTNDSGGITDDLMLANRGDHVFMVVNAACKAADIAHLTDSLVPRLRVTPITDRALIALQGPAAEQVLCVLNPDVQAMRFMDVATLQLAGAECWVSRSGYTGEDGFEISVPAAQATALAETLLADANVAAIGLGARDSLRLEAGLCLYGHDIDATTTPVEANLAWAIQKSRRTGGAQVGGFPGADRILRELKLGVRRTRVGLIPDGRAPMREGVKLFADPNIADPMGHITSGGFGPTVGGPVAMGYVETGFAAPGTTIYGELRGKRLPVTVTRMPFTPSRFKR
jgi:aminomethyltransferase